jgi:hypothetical protein
MELYAESTLAATEAREYRWISAYPYLSQIAGLAEQLRQDAGMNGIS